MFAAGGGFSGRVKLKATGLEFNREASFNSVAAYIATSLWRDVGVGWLQQLEKEEDTIGRFKWWIQLLEATNHSQTPQRDLICLSGILFSSFVLLGALIKRWLTLTPQTNPSQQRFSPSFHLLIHFHHQILLQRQPVLTYLVLRRAGWQKHFLRIKELRDRLWHGEPAFIRGLLSQRDPHLFHGLRANTSTCSICSPGLKMTASATKMDRNNWKAQCKRTHHHF